MVGNPSANRGDSPDPSCSISCIWIPVCFVLIEDEIAAHEIAFRIR